MPASVALHARDRGTAYEDLLDSTKCDQTVVWSHAERVYCWAHGPHRDLPTEDCPSPRHACNEPGTGRLGLCPRHEMELLG